MTWRDLHSAPRDRKIWLFLPAASWKSDANGRPSEVTNAVVLASWSRPGWFNVASGSAVYPSLWNDADVAGPAPDMPSLG